MPPTSRRGFIASMAGGLAACYGSSSGNRPPDAAPGRPKVALIHTTDLFRPHADPDDHFDLTTAFALAAQGRLDLLAVLIDHPPAGLEADPDVLAVAQLNRITGLSVPVLTGSAARLDAAAAGRPENRESVAGARGLLRIMRASSLPVAVSIVGSARDVALASRLDPDLFAAKCCGVYLNSGSGTPDRAKAARLEYNVSLDPVSYATLFDLPCPLYWMPCFEVVPGNGEPFTVAEFGTYYRFLQKDLLPRLSPRLQNYFAFMFKQGDSDKERQTERDALRPNWLRYLEGPPDRALLERQGERYRNVWSTAAFFHAGGLSVARDGGIREGVDAGAPPVYAFEPIRVRCGADGITAWSPDPAARDRRIFRVRDAARYPAAMTAALGMLLASLA